MLSFELAVMNERVHLEAGDTLTQADVLLVYVRKSAVTQYSTETSLSPSFLPFSFLPTVTGHLSSD